MMRNPNRHCYPLVEATGRIVMNDLKEVEEVRAEEGEEVEIVHDQQHVLSIVADFVALQMSNIWLLIMGYYVCNGTT